MKQFSKIIFSLILIFTICNIGQVYGQDAPTVTVVPEVLGTSTGIADGKIYTCAGNTLRYNVSVTDNGQLENAIWVVYKNNQQISKGESKYNISVSNLEIGTYTLSYKACRFWMSDTIEMRDTIEISNITPVEVFGTPKADISTSVQNVYHESTFSLGITTTGGAPDGWTYQWSRQGSVVDDETGTSLVTKESNTGVSQTTVAYSVVAVNTFKGVEFARNTLNFNVAVYPQIKVEQINNGVKVNNKQQFTLSAKVTGGYPDGNTYTWMRNGEVVGEGLSFTYSENNTDEGEKTYNYTLRTVNKFEDNVWATVDTEYNVVVSGISISQKNSITLNSTAYSGKDFLLSALVECAKPQTLTYEWRNESGSIIGNSAEISYKVQNTTNEIKKYKYTIKVNNVKDGKIVDSASETFTVDVYPSINVRYTTGNDTIICGNNPLYFGINVSGGNPSGWVYEWYRGDVLIADASDRFISADENNDGDVFITHTYKVIAKNLFNGIEWDRAEKTFTVKIYPNVDVEDIVSPDSVFGFYLTGTQELGAIFKGGYNEPGAWTFQWYVNDTPIGDAIMSSYTHNEENLGNQTDIYRYMLVATNTLNGQTIYRKNINYTVNVYSKISADYNSSSDTVISGDKHVDFKLKVAGGYQDGWTYQWYRNDLLLNGYNDSRIVYDEVNNNSNGESLQQSYKVVAINSYNGVEFDRTEKVYNVKIYPKITSPICSDDMMETKQFMEGRHILVGSNPGLGGYARGWVYDWYDVKSSNKKLPEQDYSMLRNFIDVKHNYSDSTKTIREKQYRLDYKNVSPEGYVLDEGSFTFNVKIYRRPMKPLELIRKGSASNIYIADMKGYNNQNRNMGFSDEQLEKLDYKFLFGYGENEELSTNKKLRYATYTEEQVAQRPWVRTYWVYDDGFVTSSEKFYFGDTRGGVTDIDDVIEDGSIKINGCNFTARMDAPESAIVTIYSISGSLIKKVEYEPETEFNEFITTDDIENGVYLIEVRIGKKREIRKFIVQ